MNNRLDFFGGYALFGNGLLEIYSEPPTDLIAPAVGGILKFAQSLQGTPGQKQLPSEGTTKTLRLASIASVTISFRAQNSALVNSIGKFALPIFGKADSNSGDMEVIGTIDISTTLGGSGAAHPVARIGGKNISNIPTDGVEIPISKNRREEAILFFEELKTAIGTAGTSSQGGEDTAAKGKTKKCPDCAEEVKFEARKCRYCGFVFGDVQLQKLPSPKEEAIISENSFQGGNRGESTPEISEPEITENISAEEDINQSENLHILKEKSKVRQFSKTKVVIVVLGILLGFASISIFITQSFFSQLTQAVIDSRSPEPQTSSTSKEAESSNSPGDQLLKYLGNTAIKISTEGVTEEGVPESGGYTSVYVFDPSHSFQGLRHAYLAFDQPAFSEEKYLYTEESNYPTTKLLADVFPYFFDTKNFGLDSELPNSIKIGPSSYSVVLGGSSGVKWTFHIEGEVVGAITYEPLDSSEGKTEYSYIYGHNPLGDETLRTAIINSGSD